MKLALFASILLATLAVPAPGDKPSVTGKWMVHLSVEGHENDQECSFTQNKTELTGACKGEKSDLKVAGSVDDAKVVWKYDSEYQGTPITLTFTGTFDAGKITGRVDVDPYNVSGDFTATPAKEGSPAPK
ncbi:MAG TPA: hypothetical protein VKT53_13405 [Candidatus Acidoferrum sp.]|nr:hypothetical protein [Candidatus Acidoferrum sp.]